MNDWLNPHHPTTSSFEQATPRKDAALRGMDLLIATLAALPLALIFPLVLTAALRARRQTERCWGAHSRAFDRVRWHLGFAWSDRMLRALGTHHWPTLWHILRGDMAWVGPRARPLAEGPRATVAVRPGVLGLHRLRQATAVDFMSEAESDAHYTQMRGVAFDLRLLLLSAWHAAVNPSHRHANPMTPRVRFADVWVDNLDMEGALNEVMQCITEGRSTQISFVNPDCINIAARNPAYRQDLAASSMVFPDGIGMKLASRWLNTPLRQNLNGTDFFPRLCDRLNALTSPSGTRLYLLGARQSVVDRVAEVIAQRWPELIVVGARHGYVESFEEAAVARDIRESGAQLLLVAMGAPLQEAFIARNRHRLGACVAMGVGGLFDFVAGRISRAPQWMRDAGFEWVWRLMQEPGRMWRRYLVGNLLFLARIMAQKLSSTGPQNEFPAVRTTRHPTNQPPRAVILATETFDHEGARDDLAATLPLGPASFVETIVASLSARRIRHLHIVAHKEHASTADLKAQLGDGSRWGAQIVWMESSDAHRPYESLRALACAAETPILLMAGHTWIGPELQQRLAAERQVAVSIGTHGESRWVGWACVDDTDLAALSDCQQLDEVGSVLKQRLSTQLIVSHSEFVCASGAQALVNAQHWAHGQQLASLQTDVWLPQPWGYSSAHAHIAMDAVIEGPAWIGPGCVVRSGAHVGHNVTLTANVVVDKGVRLDHAVVLPQAYVGPLHATPGRLVGEAPGSVFPTAKRGTSAAQRSHNPVAPKRGAGGSWRLLAGLVVVLLAPTLRLAGASDTGEKPGAAPTPNAVQSSVRGPLPTAPVPRRGFAP